MASLITSCYDQKSETQLCVTYETEPWSSLVWISLAYKEMATGQLTSTQSELSGLMRVCIKGCCCLKEMLNLNLSEI